MQAPLPVITTRRPDRRDRGYLAWIAVEHEVAHLPLDSAPIDASTHALEIHVDGFDEPLVVLAEPLGAPTAEGFPLRLSPIDDRQAAALRRELFGEGEGAPSEPAPATLADPPRVRSVAPPAPPVARSEPPPMSQHHAESLARVTGGSASSRRELGALTGRVLGDGRFALEGLIGVGASGEVYRGLHTALRRPIAVKVLHPALQHSQEYCARFYSEALSASRLDHRNVMRIIDYGQEPDGLLYIVMELLEGKSLQQILDASGPLPLDRIVRLVTQACAGLAHAHDLGVVHRDIKPENVIVVRGRDDEGREVEIVKVCDFGIAHWSSPASDDRIVGEDENTIIDPPDGSKVVGTPAYMAPEQIRNERVDARTDVYALGVVLYELATGRVPFESPRPMDVLFHHLQRDPVPPRLLNTDVDPDLERVILRALEKEPARRYANARVLRTALREIVGDEWATATGNARRISTRNLPTAADFLTSPADALAELAAADDRTRAPILDAVAEAIRAALAAADVSAARDLVRWLQLRIADASVRPDEREQIDRALRVLRDPEGAAALAGHVLGGRIGRVEDAAPFLVAGGPVAAHALVDARRGQMASLDRRGRFVAAMRLVGSAALPAIMAALQPLAGLAARDEEALAEDLLRSIPDVRSEPAGEVTVRFVRLDKPAIGSLALVTTVGLWGRRAQPLVLGVVDGPVDVMRLVAIEQLKRIGAVDDWAVDRFARFVVGATRASDDVRVAAASALAWATIESRPRAIGFLHQRLSPPARSFVGSMLIGLSARDPAAIVVALARALLTLDPTSGRATVERVASTRSDVRADLERLLAGR